MGHLPLVFLQRRYHRRLAYIALPACAASSWWLTTKVRTSEEEYIQLRQQHYGSDNIRYTVKPIPLPMALQNFIGITSILAVIIIAIIFLRARKMKLLTHPFLRILLPLSISSLFTGSVYGIITKPWFDNNQIMPDIGRGLLILACIAINFIMASTSLFFYIFRRWKIPDELK
jgi:hypothetical protein